MIRLLFLLLLTTVVPVQADPGDRSDTLHKLASQYMAAYSTWDIDGMSALHHETIQFNDPTATEAFKRSFAHQGKTQVADFLKAIFADDVPEHISFRVSHQFVSGNHVVIHSVFESLLPASWYGERAKGPILVSIPVTTILVFNGDSIISHTDYADYHSYQQQVNLQLTPAAQPAGQ